MTDDDTCLNYLGLIHDYKSLQATFASISGVGCFKVMVYDNAAIKIRGPNALTNFMTPPPTKKPNEAEFCNSKAIAIKRPSCRGHKNQRKKARQRRPKWKIYSESVKANREKEDYFRFDMPKEYYFGFDMLDWKRVFDFSMLEPKYSLLFEETPPFLEETMPMLVEEDFKGSFPESGFPRITIQMYQTCLPQDSISIFDSF
ncbi:uncharacterized protein LOC129304393 [Prosopis cineraria]|uniref:uncharacterized protein LOC129304393 n=1 Tax=Prosopis cineraria TaxID=364024 RepID=UPI00240FA8CD|nr:uncharacterized protein LOC129304393 [Prosopis cineraria]